MAKVNPFYSVKASVYHDNSESDRGNNVDAEDIRT